MKEQPKDIKTDSFTGRMFRQLWIPAMFSSLGWAFSDMADAVVVGQRLGTVGLAAIGLILPVYMINCMVAHGLGLGGSVRYSRLLGEGSTKEAVESFNGVIALALILSVVTAVLGSIFMQPLLAVLYTKPEDGALYIATKGYLQILVASTPLFYLSNIFNYYLRNDDSQRRAGIGSVTGNLCDIALNILLVLVLDMGTRGAALSTTLGQIITICIYLPGFFGKEHTLHFSIPHAKEIKLAVRSMCSGFATSVQYLYQMIFFLICNNLLMRLGGEKAVAVFDLIQNTSYLLLYLYEGTGRAMQPILSTYQGEHNKKGKKQAVRLGFLSGLCAGGVLIALVELWPKGICRLFGTAGTSSETLSIIALRCYGLAAFFAGINILLCNCYQACENEKPAFLLETLRGVVLLIPFTFLCCHWGLTCFWLLFLLTEAGALAFFLIAGVGGRYKGKELPEDRMFQRTIFSNAENVVDVSRELEEFCEYWGTDIKQQIFATMTLEEIGMAVLQHGFKGRTDGYIQITAFMNENRLLELHMRDDARKFDPFVMSMKKNSADEEFDMDSIGILVVKKSAREFSYRHYRGFNTLIVKI